MTRRTLPQRSQLIHDAHEYGVNPDTREIWMTPLHDEYERAEVDHRMAARMIANIRLLNEIGRGTILIHQCTVGGDTGYGMAIYDAIVASKSPITVIAYAHARSMSSIIPQAASTRIITPHAYFMIHYGKVSDETTATSFVSYADFCRRDMEQMLDLYAKRCVKGPFFRRNKYSRDRVRTFLHDKMREHEEWYLNAREAVDFGFMDGVLGDRGYESIEALR